MEVDTPTPPRWAQRFLHWYCRPELAEDLEGDLHEYFQRNAKEKGLRRARLIYMLDVIKFLRPYTLRKPKLIETTTHVLMLGSYIKTSGRNLLRNKLFSTINIAGLAISMSVGLLLIAVLSDILRYDKFNEHHARIYRVVSEYEYLKKKDQNLMATTSLKAGKFIRDEFTGVEGIAILHRGFNGDVQFNEKTIPLSGYWANDGLLKVFSFPMLKGNPETALRDAYSIVLTETAAKKLFGETEALGKPISYKDKQYTITGILKDVPKFSHFQFEMLGSLPTQEILSKDEKRALDWDNIWSTWVYLLLPEGTDRTSLQPQFEKLSEREDPTVKNTHIGLQLQAMDDIMVGPDYNNQIGTTVGASTLWIFGSLAFVVILSACINYTNLSIARSLRRTREVGIRKVVGALKGHVRSQFIVEAMILSLCSLTIALIIYLLIKPYFLSLEGDLQELYALELTPFNLVLFVVFALILGAAAGFFPAMFFARVNAIQVLKDMSNMGISRRLTARKILIVVQYCISIILITSTIIVFKQYKHYIAFDLGFSTENIINLPLQGEGSPDLRKASITQKAELLMKDIGELSEVVGISKSRMVTSVGNYWTTGVKSPEHPDDSTWVAYNVIDENYIPLHNHSLLAGRNFMAKTGKVEESEVIVNTYVLKRFQIAGGDPEKALDQVLNVDGKKLTIIGVMKEFSYGRSNDRNSDRSVMFRYGNEDLDILNIKVQSTDLLATRAKLEAIWKKHDPVHSYAGKFYSEQLEQAFSGLEASVKVAGVLAFLAISIASMGLLGMVVFTTETRLKEISIRKVLGATERGLLFLLGKGFLNLLAIATLISLPLTILFFEQVAFPELANHAPLAVTEMVIGVLAVLGIALSMVLSQTFKAARTNPAEVLKTE